MPRKLRQSPVRLALVAFVAGAPAPFTSVQAAQAIAATRQDSLKANYINGLLVKWCRRGLLKRHTRGTHGICAQYHPNKSLTLEKVIAPYVPPAVDLGTPSAQELKWRAFRSSITLPTNPLDRDL